MTNNLPVIHSQFSRHFLYSSPAQPLGPEDLTWRMVISLTLLIFLAVASMVHGYLYHEIGYTVLLSVQIHDISVTSVLLSFKDLKLVVSFVAFIFLMNLVTSTLRHAVYLTILTFQNQNADCR